MNLLPLDTPERLALGAAWLGTPEHAQRLDFGSGVEQVTPVMLKVMTQRDTHCLRLYTADDAAPAGVVGLSNIDRQFKTAGLWCAPGNARAVSQMLTIAFTELGLNAVTYWTLDGDVAARGIAERLPFTFIGRLRQCHEIDGRAHDRLLYDMLASEHQEI